MDSLAATQLAPITSGLAERFFGEFKKTEVFALGSVSADLARISETIDRLAVKAVSTTLLDVLPWNEGGKFAHIGESNAFNFTQAEQLIRRSLSEAAEVHQTPTVNASLIASGDSLAKAVNPGTPRLSTEELAIWLTIITCLIMAYPWIWAAENVPVFSRIATQTGASIFDIGVPVLWGWNKYLSSRR